MKVYVAGTRGIPGIPGGVETHCENLYPLLVRLGCDVTICRRASYATNTFKTWNGVKLLTIFSTKNKSIEAILHTFLAVLKARLDKADIIHIHAIGPALLVPFARLLGLKVIFTNHGPDYDREKWGWFAKNILKVGEWCGCRFSNCTIAISDVIKDIIYKRTAIDAQVIPNGVKLPSPMSNVEFLNQLGIEPNNYIIAVARFVPEKGLHDLIKAYSSLKDISHKLVIVGDSDHNDEYSVSLKKLINSTKNTIHTGYIVGDQLKQIFSHASLFVLPSYHEGLPISLLEAMSYGIVPLVSNIPANKQVPLPNECFFQVRDIEDLKQKIKHIIQYKDNIVRPSELIEIIQSNYNWDMIAQETLNVYKTVLGKENRDHKTD